MITFKDTHQRCIKDSHKYLRWRELQPSFLVGFWFESSFLVGQFTQRDNLFFIQNEKTQSLDKAKSLEYNVRRYFASENYRIRPVKFIVSSSRQGILP